MESSALSELAAMNLWNGFRKQQALLAAQRPTEYAHWKARYPEMRAMLENRVSTDRPRRSKEGDCVKSDGDGNDDLLIDDEEAMARRRVSAREKKRAAETKEKQTKKERDEEKRATEAAAQQAKWEAARKRYELAVDSE